MMLICGNDVQYGVIEPLGLIHLNTIPLCVCILPLVDDIFSAAAVMDPPDISTFGIYIIY